MSNVDEPAARTADGAHQTSASAAPQGPATRDVAPSVPGASSDKPSPSAPDTLRTAPVIEAIEALVRGVRQQLDATGAPGSGPHVSAGEPSAGLGTVLASQLDAAEAQLRHFRRQLDREGSSRYGDLEPPIAHLEAHIRQVRQDLRAGVSPRGGEAGKATSPIPEVAAAAAVPLSHIYPAETVELGVMAQAAMARAQMERAAAERAAMERAAMERAAMERAAMERATSERAAVGHATADGTMNASARWPRWPWFAAAAAVLVAATLVSWPSGGTATVPLPSASEARPPAPSPSAFPDSVTVPESLTRAVENAVATSLVEPSPSVTGSTERDVSASSDTAPIDPVAPVAPDTSVAAALTSDVRRDVDIDRRPEPAPVDIATTSLPTVNVADAGGASTPITNEVPASEPSPGTPSSPQPRNDDVADAKPTPAVVAPALPTPAEATAVPTPLTRPATVVNRVQPRMLVEVVSSDMMAAPVDVQVAINRTGQPTAVRAVSGPVALRAPAEDTVRQWTFSPALQDGEPVDSTLRVTLTFGPATRDMRFRRR